MSQGELQLNLVDAWLSFRFFTLKRARTSDLQRIRCEGRKAREPVLVRNQFCALGDVGPGNLIIFLPSVRLQAA